MLARLIATVAALLLACASPQADAYVRAERVSVSLADLAAAERSEPAAENASPTKTAATPKTAPPARARPAEPASGKNAALSHCRVWENWSPLQNCASMPAVYQWDGTKLAGRTNATGSTLGDYQHAYGWPLTSREGAERSFIHADTHGTPQLVTTASGAIAGWTRTDVWGVEKAQSGTQSVIGYTGYLKDPLLDELYAQARQYRPGSGRFTSVDPWEGDVNSPVTLNKYLYGNGSPGTYLDPDGRCASCLGAVFGFVWGSGQAIGRGIYDFANGDLQSADAYSDVVIQNTVAGAEIGFAVDSTVASGGLLGATVGGASAGAGISAITLGGQAQNWDQFGSNQIKYGAGGAAAGLVFASGGTAAAGMSTFGGRLVGAGYAGFVGGYVGDATVQSIEIGNGDRGEFDQERLYLSGSMGALAAGVPTAALEYNGWVNSTKVGSKARAAVVQEGDSSGVSAELVVEEVENNFIYFNKTHIDSLPQPKGLGPNNGRLQSHHGLQQQWAKENLAKFKYDPELAPSITIETGKGHPHTTISNLQNARRDARVQSGQGKWSSSLQNELKYMKSDLSAAGFTDRTIATVLGQQYKMFDKLKVPYEKLD